MLYQQFHDFPKSRQLARVRSATEVVDISLIKDILDYGHLEDAEVGFFEVLWMNDLITVEPRDWIWDQLEVADPSSNMTVKCQTLFSEYVKLFFD